MELKTKQPLTINIPQMKALLYKYKREFSSKLKKGNSDKYTTAKPRSQSDFTEFMKRRFGLEFIFFTTKQNENPYGYVIIDHNNKAVLKGSEVMKLQSLISEEYLSSKQSYAEIIIKELKINDPDLNNPNFDRELLLNKYIPDLHAIESAIDRIENEVEKDLSKEHDLPKKRGGRFI